MGKFIGSSIIFALCFLIAMLIYGAALSRAERPEWSECAEFGYKTRTHTIINKKNKIITIQCE